MNKINMQRGMLGLFTLMALTACTGTSEPQVAFTVVVQDQIDAAQVSLKTYRVLEEATTPLTPLTTTGVATGLQNTQTGEFIFAGYRNRIDVYVGDAEAESGLKLSRSLASGSDGVFKINNCTDPVQLQSPKLSPREDFLVVLGQCGSSTNVQRLWVVNLTSGSPAAWTPQAVWDNLANPIEFFAAGADRVFFAQKILGVNDYKLYAVSYYAPFPSEDSESRRFPSTPNDLEFWKGTLRYSDGSKVRNINKIGLESADVTDVVTYPVSALHAKQGQLLAVSTTNNNACLLDSNPDCTTGSDVISIAGVQDVAFDLNGYAWMVTGSSLYRVDVVAANKQTETRATGLQSARGVAWVVN